ncbi:MAG: glyoxylate/hydroxypyruvate reductase A [Pseudomonadota bacterium]
MTKLALVISRWDPQPWIDRFANLAPELDVCKWPDDNTSPEDIDYALAWLPPEGVVAGFANLKAIFSLGAGVDHILRDPELPDVPLVRVVDPDLTMRMSEYVCLHVLMHHRQQRLLDSDQAKTDWTERPQWSASAMRVGVMGLGELGRDAAEKLVHLGFQVNGWSNSAKQIEGVTSYAGKDELDAFLNVSDILVCLLPHTPDTHGILNRDLFGKLPSDGPLGAPVLINAGRGKLQVEADILASLDAGELGAATLDVFETEPLPEDSPLWRHPAVTLTPHNAADSDPEALCKYILGQIARHEAGEDLQNTVDRRAGY